jgi:hypothetical protein
MRPGLFPSQQRALKKALKKADKFDHFRQRTRRTFLSLVAVAATTCCGAYLLGRATAVDGRAGKTVGVDPALRDKLALAHALATGPDQELRRNYAGFLLLMDAHRGDEITWGGFARLSRMALESRGPEEIRLAKRLLLTADALEAPAGVQRFVDRLRQHARQ